MTPLSKIEIQIYAVTGAMLLFGAISVLSVLATRPLGQPLKPGINPTASKVVATSTSSAPALMKPPVPAATTKETVPVPPVVATPASANTTPATVSAVHTDTSKVTTVVVPSLIATQAKSNITSNTPNELASVKATPATPTKETKALPNVTSTANASKLTTNTPALGRPPMLPPTLAATPVSESTSAAADGPRAYAAPVLKGTASATASKDHPKAVTSSGSSPSLVTASGNKAWIRVDDRRTITIEKGQSLEGYGSFLGVEKGVAKFDRGNIVTKSDAESSRN